MTDQQSEQDQALSDVLGFDPTQTPNTLNQASKLQPESNGLPEDWKKLFEQKTRVSNYITQDEVLVARDYDNLFSIVQYNTHGGSINRRYYGYNPRSYFVTQSEARFPIKKGLLNPMCLITRSDNKEESRIDFIEGSEKNIGEGTSIRKSGIGGRRLSVEYDDKGNITKFTFNIDPSFEVSWEDRLNLYNLRGSRDEGGWQSTSQDKLGSLDIEENKERGIVVVRRIENDELKDEMEFPLHINQQELKDKWLPYELVRDPKDPNTVLDENWKGVDFFHDAGLRWDAVADDSLHSLTRIPEPAEDQ